jgi:hypothetical protein
MARETALLFAGLFGSTAKDAKSAKEKQEKRIREKEKSG